MLSSSSLAQRSVAISSGDSSRLLTFLPASRTRKQAAVVAAQSLASPTSSTSSGTRSECFNFRRSLSTSANAWAKESRTRSRSKGVAATEVSRSRSAQYARRHELGGNARTLVPSSYSLHFQRAFATSAASMHDENATVAQGNHATNTSHSSTTTASTTAPSTSDPEVDPDEPPPKAGFRERLRFLSRRYGWWAIAVYMLTSFIDFGLAFAAIHMLGAEHIRELEARVRHWLGMEKRDHSEEQDTGKNLKQMLGISAQGADGAEPTKENNLPARKEVVQKPISQSEAGHTLAPASSGTKNSGGSGTLWAEAVLAYTIHKTLLLPVRVAATAAILPSFVKLMVKWGLSKPTAAVRAAAKTGKQAAKSAA